MPEYTIDRIVQDTDIMQQRRREAVRQAIRYGFSGDAALAFVGLLPEEQRRVLVCRWITAGVRYADAVDMVRLKMTPVEYYEYYSTAGGEKIASEGSAW